MFFPLFQIHLIVTMYDSQNASSGRGGQARDAPPIANLTLQFSQQEDAAAAAAKPSGLNYASAASVNLDTSPRSLAPRRENVFISSKSKYNTMVANISPAELPTSLHPEKTFLLRLSGPSAVKVTPRDVCIALVSEGLMSLDEWDQFVMYYR